MGTLGAKRSSEAGRFGAAGRRLRAVVLVALLASGLAMTAAYGALGSQDPVTHLDVNISPAVVTRGHGATIVVTGIRASSVEASLVGASQNLGQPLPWTRLRPGPSGWTGTLSAPEFRGVYPVELRIEPGARVIRVQGRHLRVFAPGTLARPAFATPEAVARWWVQTLPASLHAEFTVLKRWPLPVFDHRDPRLHQLLVVAYLTGGDSLGMFVTAVREAQNADWRLLEATIRP